MVLETNNIKLRNGNTIRLNQQLNCKDYGIYGGQCKICREVYVGQSRNKFSERWNSHRYNWNLMTNNTKTDKITEDTKNNKSIKNWEQKDKQALFIHYKKFHKNILENGLSLSDAYNVFFIEKPNYDKLDLQENYWIGKFNAKINIAKTFLPKYK